MLLCLRANLSSNDAQRNVCLTRIQYAAICRLQDWPLLSGVPEAFSMQARAPAFAQSRPCRRRRRFWNRKVKDAANLRTERIGPTRLNSSVGSPCRGSPPLGGPAALPPGLPRPAHPPPPGGASREASLRSPRNQINGSSGVATRIHPDDLKGYLCLFDIHCPNQSGSDLTIWSG